MPRVLIVDDEEIIRRWAQAVLSGSGHELVDASGPREALAIAKERPIDLLLSDCIMPGGMKGPELASHIATENPGVKVILMSGLPENGMHLERGWRFLQKPFTSPVLVKAVKELLGVDDAPRRAQASDSHAWQSLGS